MLFEGTLGDGMARRYPASHAAHARRHAVSAIDGAPVNLPRIFGGLCYFCVFEGTLGEGMALSGLPRGLDEGEDFRLGVV